jgi:hypothetical protein
VLLKRYKKLTAFFGSLVALYLLQSFIYEPNKTAETKYNLSSVQLKLVILTIIVPYIIIWIIALIGSMRLMSYADGIKKSRDGKAFHEIALGMLWFALWLPFSNVVDSFFMHYYNIHPSTTAHLTWVINYSNVILLFPGFILINRGSKKLLEIVKRPTNYLPQTIAFGYIAFTALYVLLVIHDPTRQIPSHDVPVAAYYESDWWLTFTIVIPRLIMWFLGLQAAYNIYLYRDKVKGALYRLALDNLAKGTALAVIIVIVLRFFQSLSTMMSKFGLGLVLLIVYVLLIFMALGYILIAKGAGRLQKLEDL